MKEKQRKWKDLSQVSAHTKPDLILAELGGPGVRNRVACPGMSRPGMASSPGDLSTWNIKSMHMWLEVVGTWKQGFGKSV